MNRKGILLAGGVGSRLRPATLATSKHLLPIYDKPMAYYSLSVLMQAGIRDILIISSPEDKASYQRLFGQGEHLGLHIQYAEQPEPEGIAQAFEIAESFLGGAPVCLVLGDNVFYGKGFSPVLKSAADQECGARVFAYAVKDPERFGVVTLSETAKVIHLEEKPVKPSSNLAITGLYFFDSDVVEIAKGVRPSARGEKEIVDVLAAYQGSNRLKATVLDTDFVWLDAGTPDSLLEATALVQAVEQKQGRKIACLEEIAWRAGWISSRQLRDRAQVLGATDYSEYMLRLASSEQG